MPVAKEADANSVREEIFPFNLDANSCAESVDQLRSWTRSFNYFWENGIWSIIFKNHFFSVFMSFNPGGIFVTNARKLSEDRHWNFITMSYRTTCWLKIRILKAAPVLSIDPSQINSSEVAVSDMVCRLPPIPWEFQSSDSPCHCSTLAESRCMPCTPGIILVSRFNTKISMVSTRYETCDWLSIRSNGVFSTYVAEHVGLISARSSGRSCLIQRQK